MFYPYLPDDLKYETFLDIYTSSDLDNQKLTIKILEELKKLKPDSVNAQLSKMADEKGFLIIYRGECTESTSVKKAISWTTDRDKAVWFAQRFLFNESDVGYLYQGKAHIKNIIGYDNSREESEIIVRHKYIEVLFKEEVRKINITNDGFDYELYVGVG